MIVNQAHRNIVTDDPGVVARACSEAVWIDRDGVGWHVDSATELTPPRTPEPERRWQRLVHRPAED